MGVSLAFVLYLGASPLISRWHVSVAKVRGDRVVQALEEFRAAEGVYPKKLQKLVPNHLDALPQPFPTLIPSEPFSYYGHADSFSLSFPIGVFDSYEWHPERGWWFLPF